MVARLLAERIEASRGHTLLLGPVGVGKSTLARKLSPLLSINLADERTYLALAKDPGRLVRELAGMDKSGVILIDEIQRLPSLFPVIQPLIDAPKSKFRFLLTASSTRRLRRILTEQLLRRVQVERLGPLTTSELTGPLDFERALQVGMLPGVYPAPEAGELLLDSYLERFLHEQVDSEGLTRTIGPFARFVDAIAACEGGWVDWGAVCRRVRIPRATARRYVQVLEDTLLIYRLSRFQADDSARKSTVLSDRILFFDVGVRRAILRRHREPIVEGERLEMLSQWFLAQVFALAYAHKKPWELSCYRDDQGSRIDLIIETASEMLTIVLSTNKTVGPGDLRPLQLSDDSLLGSKKPRKWLVYNGSRPQHFGHFGVALPLKKALDDLSQLG